MVTQLAIQATGFIVDDNYNVEIMPRVFVDAYKFFSVMKSRGLNVRREKNAIVVYGVFVDRNMLDDCGLIRKQTNKIEPVDNSESIEEA